MANWVDQLISEAQEAPFKPYCHYVADGDVLEIFVAKGAFIGERVDETLTVHWSRENRDTIVGIDIKGFSLLKNRLEEFGVTVSVNDRLRLGAVLLSYLGLAGKDTIPVLAYNKVVKMAEQHREVPMESTGPSTCG